MKTTFIYLGLVALSFNQTIVAKELPTQNSTQHLEATTLVFKDFLNGSKTATKELSNIETSDVEIFDPNTVINSTYQRSIEEVIAENNLITESTEEIYQPIVLDRTLEDTITENNQIIENDTVNEVYPLDFEKINNSIQSVKVSNNKATVIIDLKL